ncbi:MAG TPA: hypothetical protein VLK65_09530 [Vicinamibacteria bacterium]|nr:hypothetical protein [Vicinamibacteria bacterium]
MTSIGGIRTADATRAEFDDSASANDFRELAKQPSLKVVQCSAPVRDGVWRLVNEHLLAVRPDVEVRVYGHYSSECDLSFARLLPNVRRFAADCLMRATGIEAIAEFRGLESLSLGIFELTDFSILERLSPELRTLRLGATRSKRPTLSPLSKFKSLRVLYLEGHSKDIEVLSELLELEDVTLRSITTPDVQYLGHLPKLWSLDIKLGGIRSFTGIEGKESIKYLELWQVRGLRSIDVVGALPGLQNLFLQSLARVGSFPRLTGSLALRRIIVENLKVLHDFTALETAPCLEEFALLDGHRQAPQLLLPVLKNPRVCRIGAWFGTDRKNSEFSLLREEYGKAEFDAWEPFEYR